MGVNRKLKRSAAKKAAKDAKKAGNAQAPHLHHVHESDCNH